MGELLAKILPLALGAAVSPILLTITLYLLSSKSRPLARTAAFTAGATIELLAIGFAALLLLDRSTEGASHSSTSETHAIVTLVLGILLLLLAARSVARRRNRSDEPERCQAAARHEPASGLWA